MDKKEASIILQDEILELSIVIDKIQAVSHALDEYYFSELPANISILKTDFLEAGTLNRIICDYLKQAQELIGRV